MKKQKITSLAPIRPLLELEKSLDDDLCKRIADFEGQVPRLESALGALMIGQHYGMRALRVVHSPATIRKYERLLGLKLADVCPANTHLEVKLRGIKFANHIGAYWDVVTGRRTIPDKAVASNEDLEI